MMPPDDIGKFARERLDRRQVQQQREAEQRYRDSCAADPKRAAVEAELQAAMFRARLEAGEIDGRKRSLIRTVWPKSSLVG